METEGARRTFPCFDEPEYKADFEITMIYQDPYMSVTNMPEISTEVVMRGHPNRPKAIRPKEKVLASSKRYFLEK